MLLGFALVSLVFLGIIMGAIMASDNSSGGQIVSSNMIILVLTIAVGGFTFDYINDVSKKYALELYIQNKPVTVHQSKYIVKSEEYSNDKPIIFVSQDEK